MMLLLKLLFFRNTIDIHRIQNLKRRKISQYLDLLLRGTVVATRCINDDIDGYDIVKIFYNKFTHISPCWFQIRRYE